MDTFENDNEAFKALSIHFVQKQFDYDYCISYKNSYQTFYGLKHYNLLETGSFLIRKLNPSTSCLMLQFKGKNTHELPFDSNFK